MKTLQLALFLSLIYIFPTFSQELGYINDSDGYINIRLEPSGNSDIIGIITSAQVFEYIPVKNSPWWKVDFHFRTGYIHKSRIRDFKKVKSEVDNFFQSFYTSDRNSTEIGEEKNEKLFLLTQDYPLAVVKAFCEQKKEVQTFLISEYESPIHDLIDLQLLYSRLISLDSACPDVYMIIDAIKLAADNMGLKLNNIKTFESRISDNNRPDKHPTISNQWFVSELNGKPIIDYLNHPDIDTYAKMFYQGQFAVSDDTLTFAFLDSVLTRNLETSAFYFHIFNSALRVTDGALSESIGSECRAYFEEYPCEFIEIKYSQSYSDIYTKWIDFAAFEYYFEDEPIKVINDSVNLIKRKVMTDCKEYQKDLENIRSKLIEFIKREKHNGL